MERTAGKIKWFNDTKGFGFIAGEGAQDIFVHHTAILADGYRSLKEGDSVEFDLETGPKGMKAINVRKVEAPAPNIGVTPAATSPVSPVARILTAEPFEK